jgi:hypothetical protein
MRKHRAWSGPVALAEQCWAQDPHARYALSTFYCLSTVLLQLIRYLLSIYYLVLAAQHAAAPGVVWFSTAGGAVLGAGPTCKVCAGLHVLPIYCLSSVYVLSIYCPDVVYQLTICYQPCLCILYLLFTIYYFVLSCVCIVVAVFRPCVCAQRHVWQHSADAVPQHGCVPMNMLYVLYTGPHCSAMNE